MGKWLLAAGLAMLGQSGPAAQELAQVRIAVAATILADENHDADEREQWAEKLDASVRGWLAFRDAHCDPVLMRRERRGAPETCASAITATVTGDLRFRYQLDDKALPRANATALVTKLPMQSPDDTDGPCGKVDPGECDYCGANACWDKRLAADDRALNATWQRALAAIAHAPLPAADRADWTARLRAAQRAWLAWRDATCDVEPWETPNRFAHSIYSVMLAPCIEGETVARLRYLRAVYRLG